VFIWGFSGNVSFSYIGWTLSTMLISNSLLRYSGPRTVWCTDTCLYLHSWPPALALNQLWLSLLDYLVSDWWMAYADRSWCHGTHFLTVLPFHSALQFLTKCTNITRLHCSQMRPLATDGVVWSVCVFVCLSVHHVREPCKDGWTDQDANWG